MTTHVKLGTEKKTNATANMIGDSKRVCVYSATGDKVRYIDEHGRFGMLNRDMVTLDEGHFKRGIEAGLSHRTISIAMNNTWGGKTRKDDGCTSSYETIGYHAGSVEFLDGVLATDCNVVRAVPILNSFQWISLESNPFDNKANDAGVLKLRKPFQEVAIVSLKDHHGAEYFVVKAIVTDSDHFEHLSRFRNLADAKDVVVEAYRQGFIRSPDFIRVSVNG